MHRRCALFLLTALLSPSVAAELQFNRDIRPILSDKCYHCHGTDAAAKRIPLRLDSEEAAKADLGGGRRALVPGNPEASELIRRITATDKARKMPPVWSGLSLTEKEIATLRDWVAQGAKWQKHWAFLPPVRPDPPQVKNSNLVRNPIDNFVLARLEREGLPFSPEAPKETLLRRVTLDLTGLPPTLAELDAFLKDTSPDAYEKVVDRLLASPRYAERMAARWLDAARYADTNGYQFDGERQMWRWRDWVIESFHRNQPFNEFVIEQIAGDLLPNATLDQKIATGFNRNHRINTEDGIVPEEYAVEYVVDRVETMGSVFLGLTIGCARCHNHKYDPITQKEFYQLYAYFNNIPEFGRGMKYGNSPPVIPAPTRKQQIEMARIEAEMRKAEGFLKEREAAIARGQRKWERTLASADPRYWRPRDSFAWNAKAVDGVVPDVTGRVGQAKEFDGKAYLDAGRDLSLDIDDRFTVSLWVKPRAGDGSLVSRMQDRDKGKGFGVHLRDGRAHVNLTSNWNDDAIRIETEQKLELDRWHHLTVTYDGSVAARGVHVYIDGKQAPVKVLLDSLYRPFRNAGRAFTEPLRVGAGWGPQLRFRGLIDDLRLWRRVLKADEIEAVALGVSINEIARKPLAQRSAAESNAIRWHYLDTVLDPELKGAWERVLALADEKDRLQRKFPTVMVMAENATPRRTFLLKRGVYDQPGEEVQRGVPAFLPPLPAGAENNRLGLAKWLVDPANPLLARVTVNRFWQMYFGTGLVKTVEDFGLQGEWPSHPELLDWLATEFIRSGWNVKAMQKLIVTSATYRQSSKASQELLQRDPENRLLARGPRFRLPAEMVRDQALAVAGLLKHRFGGPSVKPYQPEGLWNELSMQDMAYVQSRGDDLYRRSLYTFWKRTIAPPFMVNFDAANRETCVVRESRTNTPLQALNLMNDVTFLEAGRMLGQRMMQEGGQTPELRLGHGFRLVTSRIPSSSELQVLRDSLNYHRDYFADEAKAAEYLSLGETKPDPALDKRELAAYAAVGSLLLNLDEAVTKE